MDRSESKRSKHFCYFGFKALKVEKLLDIKIRGGNVNKPEFFLKFSKICEARVCPPTIMVPTLIVIIKGDLCLVLRAISIESDDDDIEIIN